MKGWPTGLTDEPAHEWGDPRIAAANKQADWIFDAYLIGCACGAIGMGILWVVFG